MPPRPSLDSLYQQTRPSLDSLYAGGTPSAPAPAFNPGNIYQNSGSPAPSSLANIFGSVVKGIEQPFVSLAAKPVQLLGKGLNLPDPYANQALAGINVTPPTVKGTAGDVLKAGATVGAVAAAPASLAGALATGGAIGAAQGAGGALQQNASAGDVLKQGAIGAGAGAVTAGGFYGLGKLAGAVGDKIQTSIIKPTKADIEDGFSLDTIKQYDLGGSLRTTLNKTQNTMNRLTEQLHTRLDNADTAVNLQDVFNNTVSELTDASKLKGFGANTKITNSLNLLHQEIKIVGDSLPVPDAQIVKQAAGSFGAWQYGKVDPESKASEIVFNTFYNKLKTAIEQASPAGVKDINAHLSKLIPVMNAVIRRLPVAERSNAISLNEMIGLVGSTINPLSLGPTLLAILSRSGTAANTLSKVAPGISQAGVPASYVSGQLPGLLSTPAQSQ